MLLHEAMVDAILRLTVLVVLALTAVNALQAGLVLIRLVRHVARRQPHYGLNLWLPTFTSVSDVREWVKAWRGMLRPEPAFVAIRADARQVIGRYIYLVLLSQTWAMAVSALAPRLV